MRFVLIGPAVEENLALGYLAAALRAAGHEATLVPFEGLAGPAAQAALATGPTPSGCRSPSRPARRTWFLATFSPYGEDGRAVLREGSSVCTASFRVRDAEDGETTETLRLGVTIAADGTVRFGGAL